METIRSNIQPHRLWLIERFEESKQRNKAYSLRAFAKSLAMSVSSLNQIMLGHRPLTLKTALRIANRLDLSPKEKQDFISLTVQQSVPESTRKPLSQGQLLEEDAFALISDWYHYAILSLGEFKPNFSNPKWIASQLGITEKQARDAFLRLERMRILKRHGRGFKQCTLPLDIQSPTKSLALRKYHRQNLQLAEKALDNEPIENRDFNSMTMAIDPALIPEAKEAIRRFRNEIAKILERGKQSRVYTVSIQLFPISKNNEGEPNETI